MKLTVVGLGCGAPELLTGEAREVLSAADAVFVMPAYRHLTAFHPHVFEMENLHAALDEIESKLASGSVAVGVSGDPGIFSFLGLLKKRFPDVTVVPGVGSLNCLFARLGESWADARILSGHGRTLAKNCLLHAAATSARTVVFCDRERSPSWVCEVLAGYERDFEHAFRVAVGENLSLPAERLTVGSARQLSGKNIDFSPHALVAVFNDAPAVQNPSRPRDEDFVRTDVPMTRQEVRSVILDELGLRYDSVVWDIGAGTGSVAVACALLCSEGEVHAVERLPEATALIARNRKKFRAYNLEIHQGDAPDILSELPCPTHVFVGGSGGWLGEILALIAELGEGIRVCVSAVTLETAAAASAAMLDGGRYGGLSVASLSVARSRALGGSTLMASQNPVTLWTAVTKKDGE